MADRNPISYKSVIDDLMSAAIPKIVAFDWISMSRWRTRKGIRPGVLGVELCAKPEAAVSSAPRRFAAYPPRLVLAVDNGVVLFDDGRRVPIERAETFVTEAARS